MNDKKKENTIVVLGGCGRVGRNIIKLLLEHTDLYVIVADINILKFEEISEKYKLDRFIHRISIKYADASDKSGLLSLFGDARLAVIASKSHLHTSLIAQSCVESGCDYIDILEFYFVYDRLHDMEKSIKDNKRLFITQAGLYPGLPLALIHHACRKFEKIIYANIGTIAGLNDVGCREELYDYIDAIAENKPKIFRNGKWKKASYLYDRVRISYGNKFGEETSFPYDLMELRSIPGQYDVQTLGSYAGSSNWMLDILAIKAIGLLYSLNKDFCRKALSNLLYGAIKKMNLLKKGFVLSLDSKVMNKGVTPIKANASNIDSGVLSYNMTLSHENNYEWTAIVIMIMVRQYIKGYFNDITGLKFMGDIINIDELFDDMKSLGVLIEEKLS